jgi:hypothetical protein
VKTHDFAHSKYSVDIQSHCSTLSSGYLYTIYILHFTSLFFQNFANPLIFCENTWFCTFKIISWHSVTLYTKQRLPIFVPMTHTHTLTFTLRTYRYFQMVPIFVYGPHCCTFIHTIHFSQFLFTFLPKFSITVYTWIFLFTIRLKGFGLWWPYAMCLC